MEEFIRHAPIFIPLLLALGAGAGFMAGLLGVGGGIILVPGLYFLFKTLGYDASVMMHMAVGTSLAIIIPTGISSARAHYKRGAVKPELLKYIGPGIVIGVIAGTLTAAKIGGDTMTVIFAGALFFFAGLMQIPPKIRDDGHTITQTNGTVGGFFVGLLSSLMGIGGATLNVPFMTMNGIGIHNAVATASALGPFIALPGAIGFAVIGWGLPALPPFTIGYINLPALALIAPVSMLAAPLGARAAHSVSVKVLRRIFSVFIIIVALKMIWEAWHG